jgi:hypothetical protein
MKDDDAQDKKPRRGVKGGTPGPGRPKGSKDSISREVKQNIAEFFTHLTSGNLRWRQCVDRILSGVATKSDLRHAREFRAWSGIALDRSLGTPAKATIKEVQKPPVIFVGVKPWENDPCGEKSAQMIRDKEAQLQLEAADRKAAEVIEVAPAKGDTAVDDLADTLEVVRPLPPEDPSAYR